MYGYVLPSKETLTKNDHIMFQSLYCGICMSIKNAYGNLPRFTTNYDITVFGLIAIEAIKPEIGFEVKRCIADWRRKSVVKDNDFMRRLCAVNLLLTYYKATDDVIDSGGKKKLFRRIIRKPYQKAKLLMPEADKIISSGYGRLRRLELANCDQIDRVSDCFATLLEELIADFIKEPRDSGAIDDITYSNMRRMCYNIGKFVYLADALDDIDKDVKKKNYNPFLAKYPDYERGKRAEFMSRHSDEISFYFNSTINRAIECSNALVFTQVNDLLRNIIYDGLRGKAKELLSAAKQLPPPKI